MVGVNSQFAHSSSTHIWRRLETTTARDLLETAGDCWRRCETSRDGERSLETATQLSPSRLVASV